MDAEISFGLWIQKRRKALGLTREKLAQRAGCSVSALRKIEADVRHPSRQLAELLADALAVPVEERSTFVRIARGELSIERMKSSPPLPNLSLLQSPPTFAPHLPTPATPLVGRESEISALCQMLADPHCRLITLVGPGGIGKTRLTMEVARGQNHGAAFVSLASVDSSSLIVPSIADVLGFTFHGATDLKVQLLHYLREKRMLLVLDNLEHLLDRIDLLAEIIQSAPRVQLLCTSREPLNLRGEWVFEVGGLNYPKGAEGTEAQDYSAIALFVQRARQARMGFELTSENWASVVRICQMVEGMPLAIELAASWIRILSCHEIAEEIAHSLDFLSASMRDMPERHRSMRAVFDHSWRLLTEEEQRVLSELTVFRGGFTREAAEWIAEANLDLLSALVAKSLVQRSGESRFSLHEMVQQYAARQLETTNELGPARQRHITFFTDLAEIGKRHFGTPMMADWLERMEQDNDNLRAALDYILALQASEMALWLGAALGRFWEYRGQMDEGLRWLKAILALPGLNTDEYSLQRARVLNGAGSLARIQGDFAQARRFYEESLAIRRKTLNMPGISASLNSLGVLAMFEGKYTLAETHFQESLQICLELGIQAEVVKRLNNLGVVAMYQGEYEKARALHEEAMALYQKLDDQHGIAGSLGNLGDVLRYQGQYDRATQVLEESLAILHETHDAHGTVITLGSLARVQMAKGDVNQAMNTFHTCLSQNREVGDKTEIATDLEGIADVLGVHARRSKKPEEEIRLAVRLLAAAGQLRASIGAPRSAAEQVEFERITTQLKAPLTSNDFALELECGAAMTAEQAVEEALNYLSQIQKSTHTL